MKPYEYLGMMIYGTGVGALLGGAVWYVSLWFTLVLQPISCILAGAVIGLLLAVIASMKELRGN